MTTSELLANAESIHPPPGVNKLAIAAADGSTRYLLRCWRCREMIAVDRRIFGLHDATTCPQCQAELRCDRRRGFTLVELLVVIAIIGLLVGIVLIFLPSRESRLAADGASQLQAYLASARNRATRDNQPVGVRLMTADNGKTFTGAVLVTSAEPLTPIDPGSNTIYLDLPAGRNMTALSQNTATQVGMNLQANGIAVGDLLEIVEVPSVHRITAIDYATNTVSLAGTVVMVDDGMGGLKPYVEGVPAVNRIAAARLTRNYRYVRAPRPLLGEQPWQLPQGVVIRGATGVIPSSLNVPVNAQGDWEIRFAPGGGLLNAQGRVVLWIEDVNRVSKPTLLCIYQSGQVAAHSVGPAGQEYAYTQDGRAGQ